MNKTRSINHMKCYLFRMAQEKWSTNPKLTATIFNENKLFNYIEDCYDLLCMSSYKLALNDLETILKNSALKIEINKQEQIGDKIGDEQKNAAAIMLLQMVLEKYSGMHSILIEETLTEFVSTPMYNAIFDFDTELWKEGPDYILDLLEKQVSNKTS